MRKLPEQWSGTFLRRKFQLTWIAVSNSLGTARDRQRSGVKRPDNVILLMIVSGQALVFGHALLFAYVGVLVMVFHLFVVLYEEPTLRQRFGKSHEIYCVHVRRWWPRLTPWREADTAIS